MALRRKKQKPAENEKTPEHLTGDTLSRIEAVTDRLEWLAAQIEEQLKERGEQ